MAPAEIYGVATFYDLFSLTPRSGPVVRRCVDVACQVRGAAVGPGEHASPCLGLCERAPAALVIEAGEDPRAEVRRRRRLGRSRNTAIRRWCSSSASAGPTPTSIDDYRAHGGYAALRAAVALGPAGVLRELADSGLVGRGGAAFPTGRKWSAVAAAARSPEVRRGQRRRERAGHLQGPHRDGGRPVQPRRSHDDRRLHRRRRAGLHLPPRRVPAGPAAAGHRLGTPPTERGLLGSDVLGFGFGFDLELRIGAGAYICGEETALFNSLEGFRGEPRSKPPFPVEVGLFGRPTLVNNVETLLNVLPIVLRGGAAFAATGAGASTGTKLFCVSGHVEQPGLYEVPFGTTLRQLLELAGGTATGRRSKPSCRRRGRRLPHRRASSTRR